MIRVLLEYVVYPLLLFFLVRAVLRSIVAALRPRVARNPCRPPSEVPSGGELKKDPVCGTYVSASASLTRTVNGEVLYFCSPECRDKYRAG